MTKHPILKWLKNLWDSALTGGATSALSAFGLAGAHSIGVQVTPLDFKQTGGIFLAGAAIEVLRFIKNKPSPDIMGDEDSTGKEP